MKKDFVPYDLALVLKELGFDEPCVAFYYGQLNRLEIGFNWLNEGCKNSLLEEITSAPLYQQVFRWFRDKGFNFSINSSTVNMLGEYRDYYFYISKGGKQLYGLDHRDGFDKYEQAEFECLKKLIELLNKY